MLLFYGALGARVMCAWFGLVQIVLCWVGLMASPFAGCLGVG
jgi:hypothetical protein